MTVPGVEVFGIPVEIISPFLVTALGGVGVLIKRLLIKRRWFSDATPPAPTAPRLTMRAAAHDYVSVILTPQVSSAPRQRAAAALTEAASAVEQDAPEAAGIAYSLAAEPDRTRAAALKVQLDQALKTHR